MARGVANISSRAVLKGMGSTVAICAALLLIVISLPRQATAEHCGRTERVEAKQHKQKGWRLRDEAPEESAKALAAAYKLCPDPWYLGHLALLYEKMGRIREAIQAVDAYLEHDMAKQRDQAVRGRKRLEALLGRVRIRTTPPGAELLIDGEELDEAPFTPAVVDLDPGDHLLEARLDDHLPSKREITVQSGEEHRVKLTLEPVSDEPPPTFGKTQESSRSLRWTFSLQVGAGVTFPLGTETIGTAFALPFDIAGGLDLEAVRIELLAQLVIFPDTNGLILQVGGGLRIGIKLGDRPLYLGAELVLGLSQINVNTTGRMIPEGQYSSLGIEPALWLSWQVVERLEIVARALRFELMGLSGDLPGGPAFRLGLDLGLRLRF